MQIHQWQLAQLVDSALHRFEACTAHGRRAESPMALVMTMASLMSESSAAALLQFHRRCWSWEHLQPLCSSSTGSQTNQALFIRQLAY